MRRKLFKKITQAVINIINGKQKFTTLGNLNAKRDWGDAGLCSWNVENFTI